MLTFSFKIRIHHSPVEYRMVRQCDHRTERAIHEHPWAHVGPHSQNSSQNCLHHRLKKPIGLSVRHLQPQFNRDHMCISFHILYNLVTGEQLCYTVYCISIYSESDNFFLILYKHHTVQCDSLICSVICICDIYSLKCCTVYLHPVAKSQLSNFVLHKCFLHENDYHTKNIMHSSIIK